MRRSNKTKSSKKGSPEDSGSRPNTRQLKLTQLKLADPSQAMATGANVETEMLTELRKLRAENSDFYKDTKTSLSRLEASMTEIKQRMDTLDQRVTTAEQRVSNTEDKSVLHGRALAYLLKKEASLAAKCDQLENMSRRNNIRLFGIKEGLEMNDMSSFIQKFLSDNIHLEEELPVRVERAHRATVPKPKESTAPPRSIIVRFLDYSVKQTILQQAWSQGNIELEGKRVVFDHDYSQSLQRKRKAVWEVIKKLKEKNIKARTIYPAQIKITLDTGDRVFPSLLDARETLGQFGIKVDAEERDVFDRELMRDGWRTQGGKRRGGQQTQEDIGATRRGRQLNLDDIRSIIQEDGGAE